MRIFRKNFSQWRLLALVLTVALIFSPNLFVAHAQNPQAPYALLQYSTLTGSGNTITATQIPIVLGSGLTVYASLSMQFNVDAAGNLTLSPGYPQVAPAPLLLTSSFMAGQYAGPSTILAGKALVTVSGPGVTDGGATEWSLSAASGANIGTYPGSATWYVGPIASSPLAARLSNAKLTSTAWSYGIATSSCGCSTWQADTLIGASQIGNTITFVSFTRNGVDANTPFDQITYKLAP
jgi:hypothetical protein